MFVLCTTYLRHNCTQVVERSRTVATVSRPHATMHGTRAIGSTTKNFLQLKPSSDWTHQRQIKAYLNTK